MLTSQSWWWLLWLEQSSKPLAASDNRFGAVLPAWYSWLSGSTDGCGFSTAGDSKGGFSGSFEGTAWWPGLGFAETREANIYLNLVKIHAWRSKKNISSLGKRCWWSPGKEAVTAKAAAPNIYYNIPNTKSGILYLGFKIPNSKYNVSITWERGSDGQGDSPKCREGDKKSDPTWWQSQ